MIIFKKDLKWKRINKFFGVKKSQRCFSNQEEGKEPSVAEKCKALLHIRKSGTFTTVSPEQNMFGGLMPYVLSDVSLPIFALRPSEKHCQHLRQSSVAALVVWTLTPKEYNPSLLCLPRVNFYGEIKKLEDSIDVELAVEGYKRKHKGSLPFLSEFEFFQLEPKELVYVSQAGNVTTLSRKEYLEADLDPMAEGLRFFLILPFLRVYI